VNSPCPSSNSIDKEISQSFAFSPTRRENTIPPSSKDTIYNRDTDTDKSTTSRFFYEGSTRDPVNGKLPSQIDIEEPKMIGGPNSKIYSKHKTFKAANAKSAVLLTNYPSVEPSIQLFQSLTEAVLTTSPTANENNSNLPFTFSPTGRENTLGRFEATNNKEDRDVKPDQPTIIHSFFTRA